MLHRLGAVLRPGGWLVLWGKNFLLRDTDLGERYDWVPVPGEKAHPGPFCERADRRLDVERTAEFLFGKVR